MSVKITTLEASCPKLLCVVTYDQSRPVIAYSSKDSSISNQLKLVQLYPRIFSLEKGKKIGYPFTLYEIKKSTFAFDFAIFQIGFFTLIMVILISFYFIFTLESLFLTLSVFKFVILKTNFCIFKLRFCTFKN